MNPMKNATSSKILTPVIALLLAITLFSCKEKPVISLADRLATLPGAKITKIECDSGYKECYEIMIPQPIDHHQPEGLTFLQRIYLSHADSTQPMVLVTEGYDANRNYTTELARFFHGNQIIVEHRYFGKSVPDSMDWRYLDTWQAASDHHRIISLFKEVYPGKWIATGVSKGGQTTMYQRFYYPKDVDISVPYVAPLNFSIEDPRIYEFLKTTGTEECRARIRAFQDLLLDNRNLFYPTFLFEAKTRNLTFTRVGPEAAYEYCVLEYPFAFWQYGRYPCEAIPMDLSDTTEVFNHFNRVSFPFWFSDQGIKSLEPFFYQAMTEIGYYGYDLKTFEGRLKYVTDPTFRFSAPRGVDLTYHPEVMKKVDHFIKTRAHHFIFLYGETDTWSATAAQFEERKDMLRIVKKGGSHNTRIGNLPPDQKELVMTTLTRWLK
jgi:hypothetical protein